MAGAGPATGWAPAVPGAGAGWVPAASAGWAASRSVPGWGVPPPAGAPRAASSSWKWALGGGAAVFLGSLLPFVTYTDLYGYTVVPGARLISAVFGAILAGLALGAGLASRTQVFYGLVLPAGLLGALGYGTFILLGLTGVHNDEESAFGASRTVTVHFDPNIGVTCCLAGCIVTAGAAIVGLRSSSLRSG
ncbi:hypothetical protein [Frankia sp. AiPa1]|uniref:hypothetical protein n=1 Tax=Frankia sp. AiPa1 TaxID=573492 RepID=UPI00202B3585|nr:hypothetical protein [Frankia sp. AiPa1]